MNSSADLIARARNGDQEAFRLIFDRYARPVLSFIYDLVGQRDLAEELAQETFVRAFKNLKQIRDDTKLSSWLFGISRNVALEAVRSRQKDYRNHDAAACLEIIEATQLNPDQDLLQKELNGAMNRALHSMNDEWRTIFVLKVLHQRSYQEIVEITGFSLAKVKTDLHRARLEMRRRMGPLL
jgi:RNA polymerase sigma-70 factor (ECF subfamily)